MNLTHRAARPRRGHALALAAAVALPLLAAAPAALAQSATEQVQVRSFRVQGNSLLDAAAV